GREVAEETTDCPYCGADPDTGGIGQLAARKKARGVYEPEAFTSKAFADALDFTKKNAGIAVRTGTVWTIFGLLAFACLLMRVYCVAVPPKMFFTFFSLVALLVCVGWMWVLQLEVVRQTMQKRTKLKRVNFDMALSASSAIVMLGWSAVMGAPAAIAFLLPGLIFTASGNEIGPVLLGFGGLGVAGLAALAWPGALPHVAMPQQVKAWMPQAQVAILLRTSAPRAYCTMLMLAGAGLVAATGAGAYFVAGPPLLKFVDGVVTNATFDRAIAKAQAGIKEAQNAGDRPDTRALRDAESAKKEGQVELDFTQLIIPGACVPLLAFVAAFAFVFNTRPTALYAKLFAKQLDLDGREKEVKYVAKEQKEGEADEDEMNWSKAGLIIFLCSVLGIVGGVIASAFSDAITMSDGLVTGADFANLFLNLAAQIGFLSVAIKLKNPLYIAGFAGTFVLPFLGIGGFFFPVLWTILLFGLPVWLIGAIAGLVMVFRHWDKCQFYFAMNFVGNSLGRIAPLVVDGTFLGMDDAIVLDEEVGRHRPPPGPVVLASAEPWREIRVVTPSLAGLTDVASIEPSSSAGARTET
ncbi:MAG: hypothetical protein AAGJ97_09560, partial [Planctomycetota bacterium]